MRQVCLLCWNIPRLKQLKGFCVLPYGRQSIDEDDIEAVAAVLRGDFLTTGPKVAEFEESIKVATGAPHVVACSNGTTALHLAAIALGISEGDDVIVPTLTFLATANALRYTGANVVFADVDPETGLMGAEHLKEALTRAKNPKAVFPVHLTGQAVELKSLKAAAPALKMVADSCHALGGVYNGALIGACQTEDMATFSFHPVKTIATGEGGAITTNNAEHAALMRRLRSHGMAPAPEVGPWAYEMQDLGYNYRITDFQCALGLSQMSKLGAFVKKRRELADYYDEILSGVSEHIHPPALLDASNTGLHLYAPRFDFGGLEISRAAFMDALRARGVGTQVHYIPVHTQPYYKNLYGSLELEGAQAYYERTLSLPLYPAMEKADVEFVVNQIKDIIGAS